MIRSSFGIVQSSDRLIRAQIAQRLRLQLRRPSMPPAGVGCKPLLGHASPLPLLPHLVAKRDHPARVRFHLHEVQGDILVEPVEE